MKAEKIAVRSKEAAKMLGISNIWLKQLTRDGKGPKSVKRGRARLYPVKYLQEWITDGIEA